MSTMLTPDTAPRDAAQLATVGPFVHRRLGEALGELGFHCWQDERTKSAFVTASHQDRAQILLTQLQALDAKRGGAPAPQEAAAPPQAPPPPQAAPQEAPAANPSGRSPQTGKGGTPPASAPAQGNGNSGNVLELLTAMKGIQGTLEKLGTNLGKGSTSAEVSDLRSMLAAVVKMQTVEIGLLCLIGETVLGAAPSDFVKEAVSYGGSALQELDSQGKAGG